MTAFKVVPNYVKLSFIALSLLNLSTASLAQTFTSQELKAMGQGIYEQSGSNSCMYCHGISGVEGKVAASANLKTPKAWKSYKALGGDAAFTKDRTKFLEELKKATVNLIKLGAVSHNMTYKVDGYDLGRAGGPLNAQMLGVSGAPSAQWIRKYQSRGVNKDLASEASFEYLKGFDTQGVFN